MMGGIVGAMPIMEHETTGEGSSDSSGGAARSRTPGHDDSGASARHRTIATLVADRERRPHARGARSLARWRRRLLYQAGTIEVDLEISPSKIAGRLRLLGQVTTGEPS